MKICFFADGYLPKVGGAQMVLHQLLTRLTPLLEQGVVLAPRVRGRDNHVDAVYPIVRYQRPFSKTYGVEQLLWPLGRQQWRHRFDLLHCHSAYPPAYIGWRFQAFSKIPYVVRPHGSDILPGRRICRHRHLLTRVRRALCGAAAVIAQGAFMRDSILDLGVPSSQIEVIHNGVDLAQFAAGNPFPHAKPYILGLGSLVPRKGFDLLIDAFARTRNRDVDLILAGDGFERKALEQRVRTLQLADRVRFVGQVSGSTKVDLFRSAQFLIVPSRTEPFANVILEGLAAGLPVIASRVDGNPELVHHDRHGLLFENGNVEELAAAMQHLLDSPATLSRLRAAIPDFVRPFDWSEIAMQYLSLYQRVVDGCAANSGPRAVLRQREVA